MNRTERLAKKAMRREDALLDRDAKRRRGSHLWCERRVRQAALQAEVQRGLQAKLSGMVGMPLSEVRKAVQKVAQEVLEEVAQKGRLR